MIKITKYSIVISFSMKKYDKNHIFVDYLIFYFIN